MTSSVTAIKLETDKSSSWFKPAQVFDADFDAEAYLSDLRRFVSTPHKNITAAKPVYRHIFSFKNFPMLPVLRVMRGFYLQVPLETLAPNYRST